VTIVIILIIIITIIIIIITFHWYPGSFIDVSNTAYTHTSVGLNCMEIYMLWHLLTQYSSNASNKFVSLCQNRFFPHDRVSYEDFLKHLQLHTPDDRTHHLDALFLGAFAKLRKTSSVRFRPHAKTRFPMDGFSWHFRSEYFSKICWENWNFINTSIWQE
jgi:hypothetical protein